jgi:hypothetical protein
MKLKLTDKGPRLDDKKIDSFEARWNIKLPPEYRAFLLRTNGGMPEPEVLFHFVERGKPSDSVLDQFYILRKGADDPNLDEALETFIATRRMPATFLPFAYDQFGNQICISVAGKDVGRVYFWSHEREPADPAEDSDPSIDNVSLIADSFSSFLDALTPVPDM